LFEVTTVVTAPGDSRRVARSAGGTRQRSRIVTVELTDTIGEPPEIDGRKG
jgi:hypothetical protein